MKLWNGKKASHKGKSNISTIKRTISRKDGTMGYVRFVPREHYLVAQGKTTYEALKAGRTQ